MQCVSKGPYVGGGGHHGGRGRRKEREVDIWCLDWAKQRRLALGIVDGKMIEPRERLGKLRCTLAEVKAEGEAGHSDASGKVQQNWPEVYRGMALVVHRLLHGMPGMQRMVIHLHYVWREIPIGDRLVEAGITGTQYSAHLEAAQGFLIHAVREGVLSRSQGKTP